jgi:hypothetical protein
MAKKKKILSSARFAVPSAILLATETDARRI